MAQTVQWVDDLLSLSDTSSSSSSPVDPATAILDSAYGLNTSSNATNPTVALLESKYNAGDPGSDGSAQSSMAASSGNGGSGASVNVYA